MGDPTIPTKQKTTRGAYWTTTWSDPRRPGEKRGRGHCKRFGKCDEVSRGEAMRRFQRWLDKEYPALRDAGAARYSVDQLCQDYFAQVGKRYVVDGKHTTSINRIRIALNSFRAMYGTAEADSVTAGKVARWLEHHVHERLPFKKNQKAVATGPKTKETVNLSLSYVKRMFRWGAKFGHVSDATAGAVQLVENLRGDHAEVRRKEDVRPVAWETVRKTLATDAGRRIEAPVLVMWHTGMRPGEVLSMRPCDVRFVPDGEGGSCPVYFPRRHKTQWRGKTRSTPLGTEVWKVIQPLLPARTDAPIFTRPWNGRPWTTGYFREAVHRAATAAGVEWWHPNQIRHAYATRVAERYGAEAVSIMLGHDDPDTQKVYVEKSLRRAIQIAREVG